mmetsp:Transcript_21728/g.47374  ORF Transcript_21728/g.47374 Transcript_21728/m.47374 type:complete len:325 (+) Transcript_21728:42-1016(+)
MFLPSSHTVAPFPSKDLDLDLILALRGGDTAMSADTYVSSNAALSLITSALVRGPHIQGVAALFAVSFATVATFTMIRTNYAFTVGYGASVAVQSAALMASFGVPLLFTDKLAPSALLANASLLHGIRLAAYLALRNATVPSKSKQMASMDKTPRLKRLPLALNVSLLYAFMVTPVLYALRGNEEIIADHMDKKQMAGVAVAYLGLAIEAIADAHKFIVKRQKNADYGCATFVGPTGGTFLLCRHPSYFGEVLFWFGLLVGGAFTFRKNATAWICSTLGMIGISFVMFSASKRLDKKQLDTYGGQKEYDEYRARVRGSLIPFVN